MQRASASRRDGDEPPERRRDRRADRAAARRARRLRRRPPAGEKGRRREHLTMVEGKRVAVVVPAYDEEAPRRRDAARDPGLRRPHRRRRRRLAGRDRRASASRRRPAGRGDRARARTRGVGAAIVTGYKRALAEGDRRHLRDGRPTTRWTPPSCSTSSLPVARGEVDYAKANRLFSGEAWEVIPRDALPRQRRALAAHQDRLGVLARRRLAGRATRRSRSTR